MRIHFCGPTVKARQVRLQWAVKGNTGRLIHRITGRLDCKQLPVADIEAKWGSSPASVYNWLNALILTRMN